MTVNHDVTGSSPVGGATKVRREIYGPFSFIGNFSKKSKKEKSAYWKAGTRRKDVGKLIENQSDFCVIELILSVLPLIQCYTNT